jgi:hypothetical protein
VSEELLAHLEEADLAPQEADELLGFPEMFDVKG